MAHIESTKGPPDFKDDSGLSIAEQFKAIRSDITAHKYNASDNLVQAVRDLIADNNALKEQLRTVSATIKIVNQLAKEKPVENKGA